MTVCYIPSGSGTFPFDLKKLSSVFTASANVCNVVLMRHSELSEGISVLDINGNVVGTSRAAARHVCPQL